MRTLFVDSWIYPFGLNADERRTQATALVVSQMLDKLHNGESDYSLVIPEQLLRQSQHTQRIFNIVMGCIAGISLLVGGIGIMNIMLANVLERTKEIGVRRAIGARRSDIRLQFLIEAITISALGGLLGIALGFAIAKLVVYFAGWSTIIYAVVGGAGLRCLDSGGDFVRFLSCGAGFAAESD